MSRKAEFLAVVKTIVDKDSNKKVKQSTIELAQELSDVLNEINVKPDTDDFKELKDVFNEQLAEMGKQPIVFSENTLKGIASQFANAISDGIKAGIEDGSKSINSTLVNQLNELTKKRNKIQEQIDAIHAKYEKYEHYSEMNAMDMDEDIKPIKIDGDIDEQALNLMGNFIEAEEKLSSLKKGAEGYEEALIEATEAAEKLFQMRLTLEKNQASVKDKSILEDFKLVNLEDTVYEVFNKAESYFTNVLRKWNWHGEEKDLGSQLEQIDKEINNIKQNNTVLYNDEQAKKYLKTLEEIADAYGRISTQKGAIKKTQKQNLQVALGTEQETLSLTQLKTRYQKSIESGSNWEDVYTLIARYINKFESDLQAGKISQDRLPEYQKLYDELTPVVNNVRDALKSLIEFKQKSGSGVKGIPSNTSPIVGTNDAKRKSEANKDAADSSSKAADEAEREKKANKESAEAVERKAESTDAEIKKQERILQLVKAIVDVEKSNPNKEVGTFYNSQTGEFQKIGVGDEHRYYRSMNDYVEASKQYDIGVHSHNTKIAAPSVTGKGNDFNNWIKVFDLIKQQIIKAREELVLFNFSLLNEDQLKEVASKYREAAEKVLNEFDFNKIKEFDSNEAVEDALSARLKQELQTILGAYDGVMTTIPLPEDLIYSPQTTGNNKHKALSFADEYAKASEEVKGLIKELAILEQKMKSLDYDDNNPEFNKISEQYDKILDKLPGNVQEAFYDYGNTKWIELSEKIVKEAAFRSESADARRSELVSQLDKYVEDNRNADRAEFNLGEREKIYQSLVDENLITDEIKEKYADVNKRLEDRLALLKQIREHEHNINGMPGDGLITNEDDPQVYYEEWFKPFTSDVENIRKSGLFSTEEIEHYNIRLAEMQDYLQSIALEALNNYIINPDEVDDAQKLNEILNQRQKILATVEQFDNPLDSPSSYEEAIKLNQAIKDRINFLQQPRSDTTGETEVEANQKKIKSYEDLLAIVQQYYNLKSKLRSINSDYPDGIDAQDYNPPIRAEMDSIEKLLESKQINKEVLSVYEALNSGYSVDEALQKIANALGIEIPQAARVAEGAVGDLNSELREGQSLMSQEPGSSALTGTGDASSEELKSLQDKNEQLRQEKENAEKDKKAANERANEAKTEAERLRNELANRDKADSEKPTSGAASIDTSELEGLLGRVTYKVKFEGESPLDNSAGVLETVKSALSNIQINASADKDAPWAREATLNGVIKNLLERIKSNTTNINEALKNVSIGPKSESKENDNIVVAKDSKNTKNKHGSISHGKADGESNSPQKILDYYYWLEEQMEQFKNNTMYFNALKETYDSITPKINKLIEDVLTEAEEKYGPDKNPPWLDSLIEKHGLHMAKIKGGEEYSDSISKEKKALDILNEEYRLKSEIFNLEQKGATQNDLAPLYEKLGIYESIRSAIENSMDNGELTRYSVQAANVQNKGETKLTAAEIKANIKTRAEEAKKAAQSVKEEAAAVQELDELYQQLAQAKAMADAESDSVLRKPFEDRVSRLQSEIDAKEANIDRTKYSQQFDDTQKESYKKQIVEELLELYVKLGEAEAKEDRMSIGNATAQQNKSEMDALYKRIEATQKLIDVNEELQNQFDAARKAASDKVVAKADKADAVSDDKSFEKLGKQYEKLGKLRAQVQSTGSAVTQEDARQLEEAIKKEQERLGLSKEQTEELERRLEIARQNELLRQNSIKQQKSFEQQIKDSRSQARLNTANSTIRTAEDINRNAMMIDGVSPESLSKMKELDRTTESLKQKCAEINAKGGIVNDDDQKDVINQIANVKRLSSEVNELVKEYNNLSDDNVKTIGNFNGQLNGASIDEYKRQLTEAVMAATNGKASIKGFDAETKTLSYSLKTGSHEFTNYTAAVRGADKALVSVQKETKRTETFVESITRKTKEIGTYLISSLSLYDVVNKFRQGIQYVREIDSALTELKKVTDETEETYDRFLNTASKTAGKVGSTIKEIVSSTADWARLGYSMEEAAQLAESTSVLLNVSEFSSIEDATSALTSTLQAFGYVAEDSMHVVDVLNEVGKFVAHR